MAAEAPVPTPTTADEVARIVAAVSSKKEEWGKVTVPQRITLLQEITRLLEVEQETWATASCLGHGYSTTDIEHQGHLQGEQMLQGPGMLGSWVHTYLVAYQHLASGSLPPPLATRVCSNGKNAVLVFPSGLKEKLFASGMQGELVLDGAVHQTSPMDRPVGLMGILGAGNFDAPTDIIQTMFGLNHVVVCKPNPVNHHSYQSVGRVLAPLVKAGYLGFVYGAVEPGKAMIESALVDHLLMTGSSISYDRIMWGPPEEQAERKARNAPLVTKPFDAELGAVSPYIVCPGVWSDSQIDAHANVLVAAKLWNNGHICASPQVIITAKSWPQREQFLTRVKDLLLVHPATKPFYPNSARSYADHQRCLGADSCVPNPELFPQQQHPLFKTSLDLAQGDFSLQTEAFCPVLVEVPLDVEASAAAFLPAAVAFANENCWGSLSATLIVDGHTQSADPALIKKAVDDLNYGSVGVNQPAMFIPLFGQLCWGAFPCHTPQDIKSGIGKIGNAYGFDGPIKSILWAPFTYMGQTRVPTNPAKQRKAMSLLSRYLIGQGYGRLTRVAANLLTGW